MRTDPVVRRFKQASKLLAEATAELDLNVQRGKIRNPAYLALVSDRAREVHELAVASGYPRSALGAMKLPLISGKISLSDFKRILRLRQDERENPPAPHARNGDNGRLASSPDPALYDRQHAPTADDLFFGRKKSKIG